MFQRSQQGTILLGVAGGMLVVASGFVAGYFVLDHKSEARAATAQTEAAPKIETGAAPAALGDTLKRDVELVTATGSAKLTWAELGASIDDAEAKHAGNDLAALAQAGSLPLTLDRDKAAKALIALKAKYDKAAGDAYLDLEDKKILPEMPGQGLDVYASLPRLEAAVRQGATKVELVNVAVPAAVTRETLGIDDISNVMGTYRTTFPVTDQLRNFNLK